MTTSTIPFNVESTSPEAFDADWFEWNAAVEAGFPMQEPEEGDEKPNVDLCDVVRQHEEEVDWLQ